MGADPGKSDTTYTDGHVEVIKKENGKDYRKVYKMVFTNKQNRHILKCSKNSKIIERDKNNTIIEEMTVTLSRTKVRGFILKVRNLLM